MNENNRNDKTKINWNACWFNEETIFWIEVELVLIFRLKQRIEEYGIIVTNLKYTSRTENFHEDKRAIILLWIEPKQLLSIYYSNLQEQILIVVSILTSMNPNSSLFSNHATNSLIPHNSIK